MVILLYITYVILVTRNSIGIKRFCYYKEQSLLLYVYIYVCWIDSITISITLVTIFVTLVTISITTDNTLYMLFIQDMTNYNKQDMLHILTESIT